MFTECTITLHDQIHIKESIQGELKEIKDELNKHDDDINLLRGEIHTLKNINNEQVFRFQYECLEQHTIFGKHRI